ncbi:MAG TPA: lysylphosphatidylglycerol synthase transmembrane domain-containing protein [Solirubrobacteraceae bacterium]|nr:lysylphosphatidylglycerol synthase transmembrane domain-containing protein [Solirubrobacteraceae bacterium]
MSVDEDGHATDAATVPRGRWLVQAAGRRHTRLTLRIATVLVTVGFTYLALHGIDLGRAWKGLRTSNYWWLLPALVAFAAGNLARALRWRALFPSGRRPPFATTLNAMMIGYLYNSILPARAGEAARIVVLTQRSESPPVEITATVLLERVYDVGAILIVFLVAQPWLPSVSWFGAATVAAGVLAAGIGVLVGVLVVFGDRPLRMLLRPVHRVAPIAEERVERIVAELTRGLSGLHDWRVAIEALLWTFAAWLSSSLCAYLVALAFHLHIGLAGGILVMVAIGLGMILPAAPAAVGVFEGATLIALRAYGLGRSVALPYALVLHLVNFVPFLLVGAALLHHNSRHPPGQSRTG